MKKSFSLQKQIFKRLHDEVVSIQYIDSHIYINPQTQSGDHAQNSVLTVDQPQRGAIVNGINPPYKNMFREINRMT